MKIITDPKRIDEFLSRGVETVLPSKEFVREKLMSGKKLKMYLGIDPTGPNLHLGHLVTILKLKEFADLGHEAILLMGDFTGMIGDPTDKSAARKQLTKKEVKKNLSGYKKQLAPVLKFGWGGVRVEFNSKWLSKLKFEEVVNLASNFTVQQMLARDMFDKRMKENKPIYLHEFLYPLMQGYDCVAMDVDGELGGNDQLFNILAGRDLMKALKNKEKFVIGVKLLTDASGQKMGKTEGNMAALTDSANDKFGKVMSWPDGLILPGFEILTKADLGKIKKRMEKGENPRDLKLDLALEVVKLLHSEKEAKKARENFIKVFSEKEKPVEMEKVRVKTRVQNILNLLVNTKLVSSKAEARRLVEQGGVKIDDEVIKDWQAEIEIKNRMVIQVGKRRFINLELSEKI
ncbi:MAG: tyrosine--tRNA ligase [Patescibacteria group bacterium]|nr:tyrosine--tRNA ligase [Patescibacteria group bacterium]